MEKILVVTDGSENSARGLAEAKKHMEHLDAKVTILTVVEPLEYAKLGYGPMFMDNLSESQGEVILENSLKNFDDFKDRVDTKMRRGNPADEILKEAKEGDYDLIVMGSRGQGAFSKALLGSVSKKVLNHAEKNVLIVK